MRRKDNSNLTKKLKALVLFSGGQDSAVCLAWALENYNSVYTIGFDYRQRHKVELTCRENFLAKIRTDYLKWSEKLKQDLVIDLSFLSNISSSALTRDLKISNNGSLPNTFLPGRNILFLSVAATLASKLAITQLIGGMCQTDFSGYPDCRNDTLLSMERTLQLAFEEPIKIDLPLMFLNKCETWRLAYKLGGVPFVDLIREETHTCYEGNREKKNLWGYGCGECPACQLRKEGYESFRSSR